MEELCIWNLYKMIDDKGICRKDRLYLSSTIANSVKSMTKNGEYPFFSVFFISGSSCLHSSLVYYDNSKGCLHCENFFAHHKIREEDIEDESMRNFFFPKDIPLDEDEFRALYNLFFYAVGTAHHSMFDELDGFDYNTYAVTVGNKAAEMFAAKSGVCKLLMGVITTLISMDYDSIKQMMPDVISLTEEFKALY